MNKIDLIIDALQKAKDGWQCFDEYEKALAAARELKALKPVGEIRTIIWGGTAWSVGFVSHKKLNLKTKLYALEQSK